MKKSVIFIFFLAFTFFFSVNGVLAQDTKTEMKPMGKHMSMDDMSKNPQHMLMMGYRQNLITFATSLRDAANTGSIDAEFARTAVAEIKRSAEKMNEIHQKHMNMMSPQMRTDMAEMMQKMQQQHAKFQEQITNLEKLVQTDKMDAQAIGKQADAIVSEFGMMQMKDKDKMKNMKKDMD